MSVKNKLDKMLSTSIKRLENHKKRVKDTLNRL